MFSQSDAHIIRFIVYDNGHLKKNPLQLIGELPRILKIFITHFNIRIFCLSKTQTIHVSNSQELIVTPGSWLCKDKTENLF